MTIKRGCSDRWRGGTGTLACDQGGCLPCIGHRHECLCHNRPCARVPQRSFPDVVPRGRAEYTHLRAPALPVSLRGLTWSLPESRLFPYPEAMEVHFTLEQEAQLAQIAANAGTAAEQLVKDVVLRLLQGETQIRTTAPELPVWHLGGVGALHRRDIYDDVR